MTRHPGQISGGSRWITHLERRRRSRWMAAAVAPQIALAAMMIMPGALPAFLPMLGVTWWVCRVLGYRVRLSLNAVGLATIHRTHPRSVAAVARWREKTLAANRRP